MIRDGGIRLLPGMTTSVRALAREKIRQPPLSEAEACVLVIFGATGDLIRQKHQVDLMQRYHPRQSADTGRTAPVDGRSL